MGHGFFIHGSTRVLTAGEQFYPILNQRNSSRLLVTADAMRLFSPVYFYEVSRVKRRLNAWKEE